MNRIASGIVFLCLSSLLPGAVAEDNAALKARLGRGLTDRPDFQFPTDRNELDKALDTNDYAFLLRRDQDLKKSDEVLLFMNWLKYRSLTGGGYVVNKMYVGDLWRMGDSLLKAGMESGERLKQAAVYQATYTFLLTVADAPECEDPSAPNNRSQETLTQFRPIFLFGQAMPAEQREIAARSALQLERTIAPLRENDDALCRGGADETFETMQALKNSGKMPEGKSMPGYYGKTILVPSNGQYKPKFAAPADWKPRRDELRRNNLPAIAAALLAPKETKN
jgi:hypothetical protein